MTEQQNDDTVVPESAEEAQRRKFREALDRKKLGHHGEGMDSANKVQHPHTGPAKPQRQFRRKSGG